MTDHVFDLDCERGDLLRAAYLIADLRLSLIGTKFAGHLRRFEKFNPYHDELGRFTSADGNASGAGESTEDRVRVAQAENERERSSILARFPDATPAEEVRLAVSEAWARDAIARAQERIPGYRPQASVSETIEGEIATNEADARDAEAVLGAVDEQVQSSPKSLAEVCTPQGNLIGIRNKRAGGDTTTVTKAEFDQLLRELTNGARETPPIDPKYEGLWYERNDGTIVGVRRSNQFGLTIDIVANNNNPKLPPGMRIHRR